MISGTIVNIEKMRRNDKCDYGDLSTGDVFEYQDKIFMKTDDYDDETKTTGAVCFSTGEIWYPDDNDFVRRFASVNIEVFE